MNATLSRISKFGFQTVEGGSEKWVNVSKYEKGVTLDGLNKGDKVEYEVNSKGYLTKVSKSGGSSAPADQSAQPEASSSAKAYAPADNNRGARQTAVNAAFGEPLRLFASAEGTSVEEALGKAETLAQRLALFVTSGSFDTPEPEAKQ